MAKVQVGCAKPLLPFDPMTHIGECLFVCLKPPAPYRFNTLTHAHLLRCSFLDSGFSWEETGTIDRHIICREKPANDVHAMTWVITRSMEYPTILTMLVLVCGFAPAQTDHVPKEGDPAPTFSITTDRGKRISPEVFGGNLLVLNFWETSCVPCVKEMPSLSDFARKFRSEHVVVVAVGGDEDAQKYSRFLRDHRIALETYRDPDRSISKSFGTCMFPETYIIQDGRIIRKVVGAIDWMSTDITAFVRAAVVQK
jgi:peroxiredoxin